MRRHDVLFVLAIFIVILYYVAENEVTATAAPEPCFFDLLTSRPLRRRPRDDANKPDKQTEKFKQIPEKLLDQIAQDFKKLMAII